MDTKSDQPQIADSSLSSQPNSPPTEQTLASSIKSLAFNVRDRVLGQTSSSTSSSLPSRAVSPQLGASITTLFPKTDPLVDGEECLHDCDSCTVSYPRGFKIDTADALYGKVKGWSVHLIVATGKTDWKRDVADEKGSVMEALQEAKVDEAMGGGKVMVSASDMPVSGDEAKGYERPTSVLVLPAFTVVADVLPGNVPALVEQIVKTAPTTTSPLRPLADTQLLSLSSFRQTPCPHSAVILLCSQRTRDARCGQSAPILRREFERHLRLLGLQRDADDHRPGGVGVYFISHVGGHKYSANVIVYRRPNAFGQDEGEGPGPGQGQEQDVGAGQCIWLARIRPEHCENIVRYTVLKGKVVNPETQLRGGFDRARGVMSW